MTRGQFDVYDTQNANGMIACALKHWSETALFSPQRSCDHVQQHTGSDVAPTDRIGKRTARSYGAAIVNSSETIANVASVSNVRVSIPTHQKFNKMCFPQDVNIDNRK